MPLITTTMGYTEILLAFITFCILCFFRLRSRQPAFNWPLVGMVPEVLLNFNRLPDLATEFFEVNNGTFTFKSFWFAGLDILLTSDPSNVHHIMSASYSNYPKGHESRKIFDILGYLFFNVDFEPDWKGQKKLLHAYFNDQRFLPFSQRINRHCLVNGLMPVLEHFSGQGDQVVDLQDVFQRFQLDAIAMMVTGYDPAALRVGFRKDPLITVFDDVGRSIFLRHFMPETCWKLLSWMGLGAEKKLSKAAETLDDVAKKFIEMRQHELRARADDDDHDDEHERFDILKCYLTGDVIVEGEDYNYSHMRDWIVNLFWAGRDTTSTTLSWFFWLVSQNPSVESKIREELRENLPLPAANHEDYRLFEKEELSKLVYLHAALCETLRLYPSLPFQPRSSIEPDTLPSGHKVNAKTKIMISSYGMGRMKSVWGEDCLEFKPERWLTAKGNLKHEPSYKFLAFSSGPRKCCGMDLSFFRMKSVAAAIIHNFNVEVIENQVVAPATSVILQMNHGLKVKISKRSTA